MSDDVELGLDGVAEIKGIVHRGWCGNLTVEVLSGFRNEGVHQEGEEA